MLPRAVSSRLSSSRARPAHAMSAALALVLVGCEPQVVDEPVEGAPEEPMAQQEAEEDLCRELEGPATAGPVEITLGQDDAIQVSVDTVKVSRAGGEVAWTSASHHFLVLFQARDGFLPMRVPSVAGPPEASAAAAAKPDAPCGTYKYSIALWDQANERLVGVDPPFQIIP